MNVSGRIWDQNGIPYGCAQFSFVFVPGGVSPKIGNGQSIAPVSGFLDPLGNFSGINLGDTSLIGGGARWELTVISATQPQVTFSILLNVTAATPDLTATIAPFVPSLAGTLPGYVGKRTWKTTALGGAAAQPAFGSFLSGPSPVGGPLSLFDASQFIVSDPIFVIETDGTLPDRGVVNSITGNVLGVQGLSNAHNSNAWVIVDRPTPAVYIQRNDPQTGNMGIGNKWNCSLATGQSLITILYPQATGNQPIAITDKVNFGDHVGSSADYWVVGTAGDAFLPSFGYILGGRP